MSNQNPQKIKATAWIKYGIIGALLLFAPIVLVNQILVPMLAV